MAFMSYLLLPFFLVPGVFPASFTFTNNCAYTVWPGVLSNANSAPLSSSGFSLQRGESKSLSAPSTWSGRFWARTHCTSDSNENFSCGTGDCGSGKLECAGRGAAPPATLAEFTLNGSDGLDFYDVSLVDGYNLPLLVVPRGGNGSCRSTGCLVNLNGVCPSELRVFLGENEVACKSACEAFGTPRYCCKEEYGNPNTCRPSSYSQFFKHACPRAYSYAYDDRTSTFTCAAAEYVITFCPSIARSQKSSEGGHPKTAELPLVNSTMVFVGGEDSEEEETSHASPNTYNGQLHILILSVLGLIWPFHLF